MAAGARTKRRCDWVVVGLLTALVAAAFAYLMVRSRHPWHAAMRDGPLVLMVSLMFVDAAVSRHRLRLRWLLWAGTALCLAAATAGELIYPASPRLGARVLSASTLVVFAAYLAVSLVLLLRHERRHRRAAPAPPPPPS